MQLRSSDARENCGGGAPTVLNVAINARQAGFDLFKARRPCGEIPSSAQNIKVISKVKCTPQGAEQDLNRHSLSSVLQRRNRTAVRERIIPVNTYFNIFRIN